MTKIDSIREYVKQKAFEFGARTESDSSKSYIERNNTGNNSIEDEGAYFGFISPDEDFKGPYHDFSFNIFPSKENDDQPWLLCLGIGSLGFKNDYELATYPGVRRIFSRLIDQQGFCKSDFTDIETSLPKSFTENGKLSHLQNTIKKYTKFLPVCQIIENPESDEDQKRVDAFLAAYAKIRSWPRNNQQRDAVAKALTLFPGTIETDDILEIEKLLKTRKYIVLEGPPGTGKTRTAREVVHRLKTDAFLTQFHAETSYSDFIYGLRPNVDSEKLEYKENLGVFSKAVKHALETGRETILIIDEINRANLANVLGPIFYLFEFNQEKSDIAIEIYPGFEITKLPENFYVIATMNTADRNLAVVDFALRRRFAWFPLFPKEIKDKNFFTKDFKCFKDIFEWYANTNELNLQPGQGYFIAESDADMKSRVKYELLPLIREYLQEGLLLSAKEELNNYFKNRIGESIEF